MSSSALINSRLQNMTREQLIQELKNAHSEEFVIMGLGYILATLPELHSVECTKILEAWLAYKREFGK
jgi:hypothetical protein